MSNRIKREPNGDDLRELLQVLMHIFEMVRRLPPGAERVAALEQIRDFQTSAPGFISTSIRMPVHVTWFFAKADGAAVTCSATLSTTKESDFTKTAPLNRFKSYVLTATLLLRQIKCGPPAPARRRWPARQACGRLHS